MTTERKNTPITRLTASIASGDTEAFGRFYDAWFDRSLAEAKRCSGRDESFCLDVVQDAMTRVITSMKPLPSEATLGRWMQVVIRSCAYDRIRSEQRRKRREKASGKQEALNVTENNHEQELQWLHEQIKRLDDSDVRLLIMRHRFGWTLSRIGSALGIKHGMVDRKLRRIISKLKRKAREDFDGLSTF